MPESKQQNVANLHYGNCPRCGHALHKKESRLICKNLGCGYKRKRNSGVAR